MQRLPGEFRGHIILELLLKSGRWRVMARALVEHAPDMAGNWHVGEEMLGEEPLALADLAMGEAPPLWGETKIASLLARPLQRYSYRQLPWGHGDDCFSAAILGEPWCFGHPLWAGPLRGPTRVTEPIFALFVCLYDAQFAQTCRQRTLNSRPD